MPVVVSKEAYDLIVFDLNHPFDCWAFLPLLRTPFLVGPTPPAPFLDTTYECITTSPPSDSSTLLPWSDVDLL